MEQKTVITLQDAQTHANVILELISNSVVNGGLTLRAKESLDFFGKVATSCFEQQKKIESLSAENKALKEKIEDLEKTNNTFVVVKDAQSADTVNPDPKEYPNQPG